MLPIDVEQLTYRTNKKKTKKKNITDIQEIMKNVNTTQLGQPKQKTLSTKERINLYLKKSENYENYAWLFPELLLNYLTVADR